MSRVLDLRQTHTQECVDSEPIVKALEVSPPNSESLKSITKKTLPKSITMISKLSHSHRGIEYKINNYIVHYSWAPTDAGRPLQLPYCSKYYCCFNRKDDLHKLQVHVHVHTHTQ